MPTVLQEKAFRILQSGEVNSTAEALIKAGYSPTITRAPSKVTESEGWKQLVAKYLPDDLLMKVHTEGLTATKHLKDIGEVEDYQTRHKYLETAYKITGRLKESVDVSSGGLSLRELFQQAHTTIIDITDQQQIETPKELTDQNENNSQGI